MGDPLDVGFYGKLPSHGDFLRRRAPDAFVAIWDAWLQGAIAASRLALGDRWLDVYLTSPAWRFVCAAGVCGPAPLLGVMVPSVDRVGRYFPLTIVTEAPADLGVLAVAMNAEPFFLDAERLVIETLEAEAIDFEQFDEGVILLADSVASLYAPQPVVLGPEAAAVLERDAGACIQIPIGARSQLGPALAQLLSHRLSALYDPLMLWWTEGSSIVEPSCLLTKGLPDPDAFASFLDGAWAERRWRAVPARIDAAAAVDIALVSDEPAIALVSAAASDVGRMRSINQDAFVERPEVGIWVVADGLGGHADGEVASRMVCDAFADLNGAAEFEDLITAAREQMRQVNEQLIRNAARSLSTVGSGSTVVAMLVRGTRLAILWAGDSRAYRWRDGDLEQLTRDHSLTESDELIGGEGSNVVTRAVGGDLTLELDLFRDHVRPGDRFLLCSDGLTRTVPEPRIREWLAEEDPAAAVQGLIAATLDAGAPDNVTVLIVSAPA